MSGLFPSTDADPTMEFLRRLDDPTLWHVKRNVPIFVPHERRTKGKDGKVRVLYSLTEKDLHKIVARYQRQKATVGVVPRITIGHTRTDAPESEQPELVGFARDLRVGRFGPEKRIAILCDEYLFPGRAQYALRNYPFRSVEYYPGREEIAGVSLLIRDPELDLGIVQASRADPVVLYESQVNHYSRPLDQRVVLYQREVNVMPELEKDPLAPPVAEEPDMPVESDELDPDEAGIADRYMKHYERNHPVMKHLCQKYGAEAGLGGAAPAMPGGMNGGLPEPIKNEPTPPPGGPPVPLSREERAAHYERQNQQLVKNVAEMTTKVIRMERERDLVAYERQGVILNVAEELADCMTMSAEQYARHLKRIQTKYERDPSGGRFLPVAGEGLEGNKDGRMTTQRLDQCLAYQREHTCTWEEAVAKCS
jgi:hypothetical protein